jgi:hypothetical protein
MMSSCPAVSTSHIVRYEFILLFSGQLIQVLYVEKQTL